MKCALVIWGMTAWTATLLGQGGITFNNGVFNEVMAPVYGPQLDNPFTALAGNCHPCGESPFIVCCGWTILLPLASRRDFTEQWKDRSQRQVQVDDGL